MGAIFGILGSASREDLKAMANRLGHKGAFTYYWSPVPGLWLGEVRDAPGLETEQEVFAFSGQLYMDWRRISGSDRLTAADRDQHQRVSVSNALKQRGIRFSDDLDGHFGVAWWDDAAQKLILGTDRINYENLYYTRTPDRFVFASEYKALLALADVPAKPDPDALQYSMATFLPNYDGTLCAGIGRVRYGHTLTVDRNGQQVRQYFVPECRPRAGNLQSFADGLRSEMLDQIEGMLTHHDRIAITLSGGLDSAGILGMLRHAFPRKTIASYTIGTGEDDREIIGARASAAACSTLHHEYAFEPGSLLTDLPKIVWLSEEFASREESIMQYQLESEIVGREDVLTGGHGADMIFGGMPRHRLIRMAETLPIVGPSLVELYQQTQSGVMPRSLFGKLFSQLAYRGTSIEPPRLSDSSGPSRVFEPGSVAEMLNDLVGGFHPFHYHSPVYSLAPLEVFMPFMTRSVMEYSLAIPTRYKVGLLGQKIVLREALKPFLPKAIRNRPKAIQRAKRNTTLSDVLEALAGRYLSEADVRQRDLVDLGYVRRIVQRPRDGIYAGDQLSRLWMLICAEIWCRTFVDGRGAPVGFLVRNGLRSSRPPRISARQGADFDRVKSAPAARRPTPARYRSPDRRDHGFRGAALASTPPTSASSPAGSVEGREAVTAAIDGRRRFRRAPR